MVLGLAVLAVHLRFGLGIAGGEPAGAPPPGSPGPTSPPCCSAPASSGWVVFGVAVWFAFASASPGVFGGGGTTPDVRHLLDALWVAFVAGLVVAVHAAYAPPELRQVRRLPVPRRPAAGSGASPPGPDGDRVGGSTGPGPRGAAPR